jgi:hypothetical protein
MKKIGIIIFIIAIVLGVAIANLISSDNSAGSVPIVSHNSVQGSGFIISEKRDLADFSGIDVSSAFHVEVSAQKDYEFEISADDNILPLVETSVSDGVLRISLKEGIKASSPIRIRISVPNIDRIEASGASKISVANLKNESLQIDSSGACRIDLAGETRDLIVDVSGAGNINASELRSKTAHVDASGASQVDVFVTDRLSSDASGASRITYSGDPTNAEKRSSGVSRISQK